MEKVINGKVYKQVKISKMDTTVTIFTEDMDEKNNEQ